MFQAFSSPPATLEAFKILDQPNYNDYDNRMPDQYDKQGPRSNPNPYAAQNYDRFDDNNYAETYSEEVLEVAMSRKAYGVCMGG